jgi:serine/threonine-protein kinase TTK/MPS1
VKLRGQDPSVIKGYQNEIILLNKLKNNERIIRLVDAEHRKSEGTLLMVLEFGEIDLENMLQKNPEEKLTMNTIRSYWEQMIKAVQAIHNQNIIHSDLKPAVNIT